MADIWRFMVASACALQASRASPDRGESYGAPDETLGSGVNVPGETPTELLLRRLASGDEATLRSVLVLGPPETGAPARAHTPSIAPPQRRPICLPPATARLVHLAALLASGASTTSLRWGVELALQAGAQDEEIVDVLTIVAPMLGSARVVAAAPRLASAIGYDIEVEGWDGY